MSRRQPAKRVLRAVLYLRISDLTDTSTSIPRQEKAGCRKAEDVDAKVVEVYKDEDKSGYHEYVKRPGFDAALDALRDGRADVLIVFKVDRATRQGIPQAAEIIRIVYMTGCRFISIMDGIDSANEGWELQLTIAAHQAHKESKNTADRVGDLRRNERDAGRWMGHRPYGFRVTPERKLELHPEEAETIRVIAARVLDGETLRSVARWLNLQGYDSPRWASRKERIKQLESKGEPLKVQKLREKPMKSPNSWSWPVIRRLLTSPTMAGYLPHKGEIYRHAETGEMVRVGPEILSFADYSQLRAMFGHPVPVHWTRAAIPGGRSKDTKRPIRGLLADFLYCGECGSRMEYDTTFSRNGSPVPRYRCKRRSMGGRCPGVLMYAHNAEDLVAAAVLSRIGALEPDDPSLLAIAQRWADQAEPDAAARRAELEGLIQEEERFLERLEDEKLNGLFKGQRGEARFRRRYQASNDRLEQYEKELAGLPSQQSVNIGFIDEIESLAKSVSHLVDR
ncbi:hypothetical protein GCM10012275_53440 [Longimycelium tulufanense]|uniref:Recombinase family protein n=1 Tax=Longimycelium tulufanense TaxID=907463 RepID=A0A8J3CD13_9PSEU|nr:recombinase family protein [Longimycelium tulufanense]GGM76051.1 hypothetical protein GCM10012275_53440 [Longimycelium tulufanense]